MGPRGCGLSGDAHADPADPDDVAPSADHVTPTLGIMGREHVTITDYKSTDLRDPARARQRARESLQLQIYAMGYEAMTGRLPDQVALHFLDSGLVGRVDVDPEAAGQGARTDRDRRGRDPRAGLSRDAGCDGLLVVPVPRHLPIERGRRAIGHPPEVTARAAGPTVPGPGSVHARSHDGGHDRPCDSSASCGHGRGTDRTP